MQQQPLIIAITGGIGSGKSIVSRMLEAMGYPVYDCDSSAKRLMDSSDDIKTAIAAHIDASCVAADGKIDRKSLAATVFGDEAKLQILNSIVHGAVREHLSAWTGSPECMRAGICFVETAILYQSGLDRMVHEVWDVEAPADLRIERVMNRNGLSQNEVLARIAAQDSYIPATPHPRTHRLINDGVIPLLPRLNQLLASAIPTAIQ